MHPIEEQDSEIVSNQAQDMMQTSMSKGSLKGSNPDIIAEEDLISRPWYTRTLWKVGIFILVVEMFERMVYYTFAGSQRNFLQEVGYSNFQSTSINAAFTIVCFLTPLGGGWIADSMLGRFKTIGIFTFVYVLGVAIAAIASYPTIMNAGLYLFGTMFLVAVGTGGIKSNINNLGADQYDLTLSGQDREQESFFGYFYWCINLGAAIAFGYLVTLATNGQEPTIPQEYGFFSAYAISAACMALALVIFWLASPMYVKKPVEGNVVRGLANYICMGAFSKKYRTVKGMGSFMGFLLLAVTITLALVQAFLEGDAASQVSYWSLGTSFVATFLLTVTHLSNEHLDACIENETDCFSVADTKAFLDTVPIVVVGNTAFQIAYNCMMGVMMSQACQMNLFVGNSQINGSFFNIGDCLAIIVCTPIWENFLYPFVENRKGSPVTRNQKVVSGLVVTIVAMFIATSLEYSRRSSPVMEGTVSNCAPQVDGGIAMSSISAFYIFIPYALIGVGEIMILPQLYYFSYDQTPKQSRSLAMAFNLMIAGSLSNAYSSAFATALQDYYPNDLNNGHIEYFYYIGATFAFFGIPIYVWVARKYIPKTVENVNKWPEVRVEKNPKLLV
eukprot:CFRG2835T1